MSTPTTARQAGATSTAATPVSHTAGDSSDDTLDTTADVSTRMAASGGSGTQDAAGGSGNWTAGNRIPSRGYLRTAALSAAALTTMAATIMLAPTTQAAVAPRPVENTAAGVAIADLTSGGPGTPSAIPADFAAVFDYRPVFVDGLLANPNGDCSSPVTLPVEFDTACKAHDLGYDLLRYAERRGETLDGWAREALDTALRAHMHEACETRTDSFSRARCHTMAGIASTFVDLNTHRQDFGPPVSKSLFAPSDSEADRRYSGWLIWIIGAGILGLGAAFTAMTGNIFVLRRRRDTAVVPSQSWSTNRSDVLNSTVALGVQ